MNEGPILTAQDLSVRFLQQKQGIQSLKQFMLHHALQKPLEYKTLLKSISLKLYQAEGLGITGKNGSGKSTLLRMLAGIIAPDSGQVVVFGKTSPVLAPGLGLEPELTGLENIYFCGTLMGMSRPEIELALPEILAFAELEEQIQQPVKRYSSGMQVRLAFSLALASRPNIFIIDEALAFADISFKEKCVNKLLELKKSGCALLMVSHDQEELHRLCDRLIYLEQGEIKHSGSVEEVYPVYLKSMNATQG